jgi:ribosomal protein S27E
MDQAMQFVLTLEQALRCCETKPGDEELRCGGSLYMTPLEIDAIAKVKCPQCGHLDWDIVMQEALAGPAPQFNESLDWPFPGPKGDKLHCRCAGCGYGTIVTFWFSR